MAAAAHIALHAVDARSGDPAGLTVVSGSDIAALLTIALVATPIAVWGRWHLRAALDGPGRWSPTRRALVEAMLWVTAVVAIARSLVYVYAILQAVLVPDSPPVTAASFAQVLVTVTAAGGLFAYGWRERASVRTGRPQ